MSPELKYNFKDLDWISKCILAEIISLSRVEKGCYISNNSLAELFGISRRSVINKINNLEKLNYISLKYKTSNNITTRFIYPTNKIDRGSENISPPREKNDKRVVKNFHPNNTLLLSKDNNNNGSEKSDEIKKSSTKIFDSSKQKKVKRKYDFVEGNILLLIEDKVGAEHATMIFANMNEDEFIPTKDEMIYFIKALTKEQLISQYGHFNTI